jgi:quinol monooxygenase YgiN
MQNLVIVEFPAAPGKLDELLATMKAALVDTRAFDGCLSITSFVEEGTSTLMLIEDWESMAHYEKYAQWRAETGLVAVMDPLLDGGAAALRVRRYAAPLDV